MSEIPINTADIPTLHPHLPIQQAVIDNFYSQNGAESIDEKFLAMSSVLELKITKTPVFKTEQAKANYLGTLEMEYARMMLRDSLD